jgi:hypothetical protein
MSNFADEHKCDCGKGHYIYLGHDEQRCNVCNKRRPGTRTVMDQFGKHPSGKSEAELNADIV